MDEKELQAILDKIKSENADQFAAFKASIDELIAGNLTPETAEKMFADHFEKMGLTEDGQFKELHGAVIKIGDEVRSMQQQKTELKGFSERLADELEGHKELMTSIADGEANKNVVIKMTTKATAERASITSDYRGVMLGDFGQLTARAMVMYEIANVFPINMADSGGNVRYTDWDQTSITRAAAAKAEGVAYPESVAAWIGYSKPVQKIVDSIPITVELLRDVAGIQAEIENFIRQNLLLKRDTDMYSGSGVAPILTGFYTATTAFVPGSYSGTTTASANIFDLIAVLRTEIVADAANKYVVDKVLMNPNDVLRMDFSKDDNGRYNIPPFISADGNVVKGVEVIETSAVTSNTLLIGDFMFARYYDAQDITLEFGYIGNQFRDDLITLKGSTHGLALIREADVSGFLKVTDIDAAIVAITTVTA